MRIYLVMIRWTNIRINYIYRHIDNLNMDKIYDAIKDKIFFSRLSDAEVVVVESIKDAPKDDRKAYFDGVFLRDNVAGLEDDIQQLTSISKEGEIINIETFYEEKGAYDPDSDFLATIEGALMNKKDYHG